ncbi:choice-of-anchor B family protein [Litorilituus lipolyticus]|uniref:Choice-of-anchor B family protein n=1 Tax=Litorilituus lipolyticus TaxID=2491017 RepID=A0A502L1C8_9GAMM|nr:choice-of-anchor B family protein [Litorilituus lipolyticus]TPH17698.1 choice-of-anchor B family protein [Litorilituus lipolyticus]
MLNLHRKLSSLAITAGLISSFLSPSLLAHSEHDKARFVSVEGQDLGKCDNVLRPCKSIAYAVQQANKGDKVLISAGKYVINSSEELFYLKSEIVPVLGGYNRFDHFQSQSPNSNVTTLSGVPSELVASLRKKGFSVIADGKSRDFHEAVQEKLAAYNMLNQSQKNQTCVNNLAGAFECHNIDLLSHMALSDFSTKPSSVSDIWGHVDLNNHNEYAIVGLRNGVAVVNVTDPSNPVEVGTIAGKSDMWRDIKVYQYFDESINLWRAYAYATLDGTTDYVHIIDLNHLPHSISLVKRSKVVAQAHNVYITNVDHSLNTALPGKIPSLQLTGANTFSGAFHSYSLENPETLSLLTNNSAGNGYTHDGSSIVITDERVKNDCQSDAESCDIFIDFNEKEMKLWDITEVNNAKLLGSAEYNDVSKANQYVHSGWGTEDQQFIFLHDEFDEYRGGLNSTVRIFEISDLANPQQVGQWTGSTRAIDHNGFVRGNRYYMSNYERGLTVLDITDPATPTEIGFFDTFTPSNSASFNGAWGTYPYLPSGNILISDINSGLYVLKDNTLATTQGTISFETAAVSTEQGETLTLNVNRSASNDSATTVSVNYEVFEGSAKSGEDFLVSNGTLTWQANDNTVKTITIDIAAADVSTEFEESFYLRLYNPTNGAAIASPSYTTVNIAGEIDTGAASFIQSEQSFPENQQNITVEVSRDGSSSGELSVNYSLHGGSATINEDVEETSGTLTWQDGDNANKTISLAIIDDDIEEETEQFSLVLSSNENNDLGANTSMLISISDDDSNTAPVVVIAENFEVNTGQTVTLSVVSVTDAENDELTYLWEQTAGTNVTISDGDKQTASFVAPSQAGELSFTLTATDTKGAQSSDTLTVTVVTAPVTVEPPAPKSSSGGSFGFLFTYMVGMVFLMRSKLIAKK